MRAAPGSAYRLLGEKDVIQWDDEYLDDDCETWKRVNNQAGNGQSYSYRLHQPMRRMNKPNQLPINPKTPALVGLHAVVRRGWRFFRCSECEHRWKWPSRDRLSPSGENCPRCDEWCHPYNGEMDATIPCDDMGNLTVPWNWTGEAPNDQAEA